MLPAFPEVPQSTVTSSASGAKIGTTVWLSGALCESNPPGGLNLGWVMGPGRMANLITWWPRLQRSLSASVLPVKFFQIIPCLLPLEIRLCPPTPNSTPSPPGKHHITSPHPQSTYRCHWDPVQVTGEARGGHQPHQQRH